MVTKKTIKLNKTHPAEFFITSGVGESNNTIHAGSYHLALKDAGIERGNIQTYSSMLSKYSYKVERDDVPDIDIGQELQCIISSYNGNDGEFINAGLAYAYLYKDETSEEHSGGLVVEIAGNFDDETLEEKLRVAIEELYAGNINSESYDIDTECEKGSFKEQKYLLGHINIHMKGMTISKRYGTVVVAIVFINHIMEYDNSEIS